MIFNSNINKRIPLVAGLFLLAYTGLFSQKGYTYILADGTAMTSKKFALDIEDKRIKHFVLNDKKIEPYTVKYFYKENDFFKIEKINEKVKRNIFKRYQDGPRVDIYYKSTFVIDNASRPERISKKQFYYEKDQGFLKKINFKNLRTDLHGNKKAGEIFSTIERQRKLRKLALGLAGGILLYEGIRLNNQKNFDALVAIPLVLFTFVIDSSNREDKLLRKAAAVYH